MEQGLSQISNIPISIFSILLCIFKLLILIPHKELVEIVFVNRINSYRALIVS